MLKYLRIAFSAAALLLVSVDAMAFCLPRFTTASSAITPSTTQPPMPRSSLAITNATCPNTVITITHEIPSALSSLARDQRQDEPDLVGAPAGGT